MKVIHIHKGKKLNKEDAWRYFVVTGEKNENLGTHDVVHFRLGGTLGSWINIDMLLDGTIRIFAFPSPEGPDFITDDYPFSSSLFVDVRPVKVDARKR